MKKDRWETLFLCGAIYGTPAAAALNFSNGLRGTQPAWYGTAASGLMMLFWIAWLVHYRNRCGYLLTSLWMTMGVVATMALAIVWQIATLPLFLEVTMYLGAILFAGAYFGLTGYLENVVENSVVFYSLILGLCALWLAIHGYLLYQIRRKKGACREE